MKKRTLNFFNAHTFHLSHIITIVSLLIILIPSVIIVSYFYTVFRANLTANMNKDVDTFVSNSSTSLINELDAINNIYFNLISDPIIQPDLYTDVTLNASSQNDVAERLQKFMYFNSSWERNILCVSAIYFSSDDYYYIDKLHQLFPDLKSSLYENLYDNYVHESILSKWPDFQESMSNNERINELFVNEHYKDIIFLARDYYNPVTETFEGIVIMGINQSALAASYNLIEKYDNTLGLLYSDNGTILSSNDDALLGENIFHSTYNDLPLLDVIQNTNHYLSNTTNLYQYQLQSTLIISKDTAYSGLSNSLSNFMIVWLFILLIFLSLALYLSRKIYSYIASLITKFEEIENENYASLLPTYSIIELNNINTHINDMSRKLDHLIHTVYENQLLLKDAELRALQNQINPHFLFNTLLCISWQAKASGNEEIHTMISALSELMSANIIKDSSEKSTIQKEIKIAHFYLYLQSVRFGSKLKYETLIDDPSLEKLPVPKLCLQPLVENAIVHGLEPKSNTGTILLHVYQREGALYIQVSDDGIGFDNQSLNHKSGSDKTQTHHQIGLSNIDQRIKYLYGEEYGLIINSRIGIGTDVTIKIPIQGGTYV